MTFDFDREISRAGTASVKYDGAAAYFGTDAEVIPMWVADMDFAVPEAITRALAAELKKGNARVFSALADRAYGKPRQQIEFAGEDGGPLQTSIQVHFVKTGDEGDSARVP